MNFNFSDITDNEGGIDSIWVFDSIKFYENSIKTKC